MTGVGYAHRPQSALTRCPNPRRCFQAFITPKWMGSPAKRRRRLVRPVGPAKERATNPRLTFVHRRGSGRGDILCRT